MSYSTEALVQSTLRTTDSTFHDLFALSIPDNGMVRTDIFVLAKSATGLVASWRVQLCAKRFGTAAAALAQTGVATGDILRDNVSWNVQVTTSGNNAVIQVKGGNLIVDWQYSGSQISFVPPAV